MWRTLLIILIAIPAFGQGSVRRYDTIAKMLAVNPITIAVQGKLTAEILGNESVGDWGAPRAVDWLAGSSIDESDGFVYDSPFGGQWIFADRMDASIPRAWFDISSVGDRSSELRAVLSRTNASVYQSATLPTVQYGGPFSIWSATNHTSEQVQLATNLLMFGNGSRSVDAGIERTGVGEITIRTNVVVDGMINLGDEWRGNWTPFWFNVKDYGAVGDGVADDTAAIQAAVDSAGALYVVYFPPGNYRTTSRIDLNNGTRISGDGWNTVIVVDHNGHGFSYAGLPGGLPRAYYIFMKDLRLSTGTGKSPQNALNLIDVSDSKFENIDTTNGNGDGFQRGIYTYGNYDISDLNNVVAGGNWRNSFRNCDFYIRNGPDTWGYYGDGGPSSAGGPNDTVITDCYFNSEGPSSNGGTGGVFFRNANRLVIRDCGFEGYLTNGVWIGNPAQSVSILNNRFENQGGSSATRRLIHFDEYTTQGHVIQGNMMLIQGGEGSITRISGPGDSKRIPASIIDPSFEGPGQLFASTWLVGTNLDGTERDSAPYGNKMMVQDRLLSSTNSIGLSIKDGTNNPRAFIILRDSGDGTGTNSRVDFLAASSKESLPVYFVGSVTNAVITATGSSILGLPYNGLAMTIHGDIGAGPNPRDSSQEGYTPMNRGAYMRSENYEDQIGFHAQVVDGTTNRRVRLSVDKDRVVLADGYTTGGGRIDFESGNVIGASISDVGLLIPVGKGISLNGVYKTAWPTDASDITGLNEWIDDRIGTTIVGGTDISVSYNDAGDSLTISYTGSGGGGGTNSLSVDGVAVTNPNLQDGDIQFTAAGTNITATVNTSAVTYAKIQNVTAERLLGRQSGSSGAPQELTAGDGLVISGTDLKLDIVAGSNVSLSTNGSGAITFNVSVPAGTNGWQLGVDGSIVSTPNLADATGIQVTASGTNITYALADRDWGDISSSASGLTLSIDSGAVTYSKIQNLSSTNLLLGRGSASGGSPQEITLGTGLSMSGTTLIATGTNTPSLIVNGATVAGGNIKDSTDLSFVVQSVTNVAGSINAGAVTFNKIQNISQNQIIGRYSSGSGEPQGITVGPAFDLLSGTIGITNSDKGDITTSSGGTSWSIDTAAVTTAKIASAAVTYDKLQDASQTNMVLGFGSGSPGDIKELTLGPGLTTGTSSMMVNLEAGTNVVLTTNGTRIKISTPGNPMSISPQLIGWARFSLDSSYNMENLTSGGDITTVTLNEASSGLAMEVLLGFSGTYATTYHVTCEVEGEDDSTDAGYWPKWWVKSGGKSSSDVVVKASLYDANGTGSAPTNFYFTFWIWRRE